MVMINGNSLNKVKRGWIRYKDISKGQFLGEFIVSINTSKGTVTAIFPSSSINEDRGVISVSVIAAEKDSFLVDLPTYTFTTGSKVWFPKNAVLLEGSSV